MLLKEIAHSAVRHSDGRLEIVPDMRHHMEWMMFGSAIPLDPPKEIRDEVYKNYQGPKYVSTLAPYRFLQNLDIPDDVPDDPKKFGLQGYLYSTGGYDIRTKEQARTAKSLKDALKGRESDKVFMKDENIDLVCRSAVEKILTVPQEKFIGKPWGRAWPYTLEVRRALNDKHTLLVPIASSAGLSMRFAHIASKLTGRQVINVLSKSTNPQLSQYVLTRQGDKERPEKDVLAWKKEVEKGRDIQVKKLTHKLSDAGRGVYDIFEPNDAIALIAPYHTVVLVDDNIEDGRSIRQAALSLLRWGAAPQKFLAITIHKLV